MGLGRMMWWRRGQVLRLTSFTVMGRRRHTAKIFDDRGAQTCRIFLSLLVLSFLKRLAEMLQIDSAFCFGVIKWVTRYHKRRPTTFYKFTETLRWNPSMFPLSSFSNEISSQHLHSFLECHVSICTLYINEWPAFGYYKLRSAERIDKWIKTDLICFEYPSFALQSTKHSYAPPLVSRRWREFSQPHIRKMSGFAFVMLLRQLPQFCFPFLICFVRK